MSLLMRMVTERAEHERVQMRELMPLLHRRWALSPRRHGVASVGGGDADRAEAEPFAAKRSGTGQWVFPMLFIVIKWLP